MTTKPKFWFGTIPAHCDLTGANIVDSFVDGRVPGDSRWGCILPQEFKRRGGKLGTGLGQRYVKQPEGSEHAGKWLKVEG
jgi:hypothetical protein